MTRFEARLYFWTLAAGVFLAAAGWTWGLLVTVLAGWTLARKGIR